MIKINIDFSSLNSIKRSVKDLGQQIADTISEPIEREGVDFTADQEEECTKISNASKLDFLYEDNTKKKKAPIEVFGWTLFSVGSLLLFIGLFFDTTGGYRTHNIGLISDRQATTNTGAALAICGAIFATKPSRSNSNTKESDSFRS